MVKCSSCRQNLKLYREKLQMDMPLRYCFNCGKMLIQKCPHPQCGEDLGGGYTLNCKSCGEEVVFCEGKKCGKVFTRGEKKCDICGTLLKKYENIFLSCKANYGRTNTYKPSGIKTTEMLHPLSTIVIDSNFSKAVIRNGIIYYWLRTGTNTSRLTYRAMFPDTKKQGDSIEDDININVNEITDIEIFGEYIVTSTKNNIYIHNHTTINLLHNIPVYLLDAEANKVQAHKTAMIDDFLIVVLATEQGERVVSLDINENSIGNLLSNVELHANIKNEECTIDSKASPIVLNNSCAYFTGFSGKVHKFYLSENVDELRYMVLPIIFTLSKTNYCITQIAAVDENKIFLVLEGSNTSYLFQLKDNCFNYIGERPDLIATKFSFHHDYIYTFSKMSESEALTFVRCTNEIWKDPFLKPHILISEISNVVDFYLVLFNGTPHIAYMLNERDNKHSKIIFQHCSQSGRKKELARVENDKKPDFQIYEDCLVVYERNYGTQILIYKLDK